MEADTLPCRLVVPTAGRVSWPAPTGSEAAEAIRRAAGRIVGRALTNAEAEQLLAGRELTLGMADEVVERL